MDEQVLRVKKTNVFVALVLCFFSPKLYREVSEYWRWKTFWFLVIVFAILWVGWVARFMLNVEPFFQHQMTEISKQLPRITIKNGVATSEMKHPVAIHEPYSHSVVGVIDTQSNYNPQDNYKVLVSINRDKMVTRLSKSSFHEYPYQQDLDVVITPQYFLKIVDQYSTDAKIFGASVLYVLGGLIAVWVYILFATFVAVVVEGVSSAIGRKRTFSQAWRLTSVAITPAMLLLTIAYLLGVLTAVVGVGVFVIMFAYLVFVSIVARN